MKTEELVLMKEMLIRANVSLDILEHIVPALPTVDQTHVKMEEPALMVPIPWPANAMGIMMVQPVVIVLHGILAPCVKHLKVQVSIRSQNPYLGPYFAFAHLMSRLGRHSLEDYTSPSHVLCEGDARGRTASE